MAIIMWYVLIAVITICAIIGIVDQIKSIRKTRRWFKEKGLK